jgi:hypothetical protein
VRDAGLETAGIPHSRVSVSLVPDEQKRYGLGMLLLVVGVSTGLFAVLGVLVAHFVK